LQKTELPYRPDIDGLRALAVLLVVAFHLDVPLCHGGFVGVDVFFVISGYLITGIIAKEIASGRFSIARFYERRARRILPALFGVLAAATLLSTYYLLPDELISYSKSMLGATFSYSNLYFRATADYFDAPSHIKPLLHTWSLAVEEQFYIFLPVLLFLLSRKLPKYRVMFLWVVAIVSLGYSSWAAYHSPDSGFYLLTSRAWELLAGSLLALQAYPVKRWWLREAMGAAGLGLILLAATRYNGGTPFPGAAAVLPVLGAVLILAAGRHEVSLVGRLLSLPPVRFIGRISYSVYLWHWPLIVYTGMGFLAFLPRTRFGYASSIMGLSLVLGALSWKFVEQPFRAGVPGRWTRNKVFGVSLAAMATSAAVALVFLALGGWKTRFPSQAVQIAAQTSQPQDARMGTCFITTKYRFREDYQPDVCLRIDPAKDNYLLLGDSHSAVLWSGLQSQMTGVNVLQASASGCNPVLGTTTSNDCGRMMKYIFGSFLPSHSIRGIFLTARWRDDFEFARLAPTVVWCRQHNIPVYIFGPVVEYDAPLPKLLAYSIAFKDPGVVERHMRSEFFAMDTEMKHMAEADWKVHYISIADAACSGGKCLHYADSAETIAFLGDDNHFSTAGSKLIAQKLIASGELPPRS
jgi:peptidoglycan/LPS O-acetylase OafA/YrhL